jgi:predicted nucleotide-binding protein
LTRDMDLIRELLLKLESLPLGPGGVVLLTGHEPELAIGGYSGDQIEYHLEYLKEAGLIECPGSRPIQGSVLFRRLSPRGHEFLDKNRDPAASAAAEASAGPAALALNLCKIFVVHGHDEGARESVARFIQALGFQPIILHERANEGRTVIEKVEAHSDVGFAVVLLTPDDQGCEKGGTPGPRARQNVVLELGYFIGRLGRNRVCALKRGELEIPSDFGGVVYESFDALGGWKQALGRELRAAGFEIDWNKVYE